MLSKLVQDAYLDARPLAKSSKKGHLLAHVRLNGGVNSVSVKLPVPIGTELSLDHGPQRLGSQMRPLGAVIIRQRTLFSSALVTAFRRLRLQLVGAQCRLQNTKTKPRN